MQQTLSSNGETLHNRLTHTLKVASLSRRLAQRLIKQAQTEYGNGAADYLASLGGLDADVAEAAGLAHDLGHAPFGHHGEAILDALVGTGLGFNGNAQAFRILTVLAYQDIEPGLNLTRATLNAVLKYPWLRSDKVGHRTRWGVYASEQRQFGKLREDIPAGVSARLEPHLEIPSVEASVMEWADDVTYAIHDVEDFFRANLIPLEVLTTEAEAWADVIAKGLGRISEALPDVTGARLQDATRRVTRRFRATLHGFTEPFNGSSRHRAMVKMWASEQIGHYLGQPELHHPDAISTSLLDIGDNVKEEILLLKELAWYYVIDRPGLASIQLGQATMLANLFERLTDSLARRKDGGRAIRAATLGDARVIPVSALERQAAGDPDEVVIRDLLATLTERQVERMYRRLNGIELGSIADSIF